MKKNLLILSLLIFTIAAQAQNFGYFASAVWLHDSSYTGFFNTYDTSDASAINPAGINFVDSALGSFPQNSHRLILGGGEVKTFKNSASNVCGATMYYTVYPTGNRPFSPVFSAVDFGFFSDCSGGVYTNGGGPCTTGDQKWQTINSNTDLTSFTPGDYTLEVYYRITGSYNSTSSCSDTTYDNNNSNSTNYTATFTVTAALPVTLLSFDGSYQQAAVTLKWAVTAERNQKGFELQRSTNTQVFSPVSFIQSQGNSTGILNYSYIDKDLPKTGMVFYRLKMVDNDGKFVYSPVLPVNILSSVPFTAQLNNAALTVHLSGTLGNNSFVQLADLQGRVITRRILNAQAQGSILTFPLVQGITHGVYVITLYDGATKNIFTKKVQAAY